MTCKGIFLRHRSQKPVDSGRYASGQKRCQVCEIFIKWDTLWCPCCGYRLRTKPRNSLFKKKFSIARKLQGQRNKIKAAIPVRY
jgi:rRNA maturation endonuclease Nob1